MFWVRIWPPQYNWNIVESGIKHHQTNKQTNNPWIIYIHVDFKPSLYIHVNREYYMTLSVSHPESTRDINIIPRALARGLIRDMIQKEPYHIMLIIYLNMRNSCSVLWTFSHMINIILRGMIKGWWYQSRQTNTVVYLVLNKGNLHI